MAEPNLIESKFLTKELLSFVIRPDFSGLHRKYGILLFFEEENTYSVKYEMEVKYIRKFTGETHLFQINRSPEIFIDDKLPDLLVDKLCYETGKILYPLVIEVNNQGEFVSIQNTCDLQTRWQVEKEKCSNYFVGEEADKFMEQMDLALNTKNRIYQELQDDWFFKTYFFPNYKSYTPSFEIESNVVFPMNEYKVTEYKIKQMLKKERNDHNNIEICHEGILLPVNEITQDREWKGTYEARYVLTSVDNCIQEIFAKHNIDFPQKKNVEIIIYTIKNMDSNSNSIIDTDEKKHKRKGFFSTLFGE